MGWDILNGIPVVGHVKGVVHLVKGDEEAGKRALAASSRSLAVVSAGALGSVGGPALAATAAVAAGALCDGVASAASKEPQGILKAARNVKEDVAEGKPPVASLLVTGTLIASDALAGLGGDALMNAASYAGEEVGKAVSKEVILKTVNVETGELVTKSVLREVVSTAAKNNATHGALTAASGGLFHESVSKGSEKARAKRRSRAMEQRNSAYRFPLPATSDMEWSEPEPREKPEKGRRSPLRKYLCDRPDPRMPRAEALFAAFERKVRGATSSPKIIFASVKIRTEEANPASREIREAGGFKLMVKAIVMLVDVLDGVFLIGQVKAVIHFLSGDKNAAMRALDASARPNALVLVGTLGMVVEPWWVSIATAATGSSFDLVATLTSRQPHGVFAGIANIRADISMGKFPLGSTFATLAMIVFDALSGFGCGMLGKALVMDANLPSRKSDPERVVFKWAKRAIRSLVAEGLEMIVFSGAFQKAVADQSERRAEASRSETRDSQSSQRLPLITKSAQTAADASASGAGASPPNQPDKPGRGGGEDGAFYLELLLDLFGVDSLDKIVICGVALFGNLVKEQKKRLKSLIKHWNEQGILGSGVRIVCLLFQSGSNELSVSFNNFLHLGRLVATWFGETPDSNGAEENLVKCIKEVYANILEEMSSLDSLNIDFESEATAVYHYFRHRRLPSGDVLTVKQYYDWIRKLQEKVSSRKAFKKELLKSEHPRNRLIYEIYLSVFERRAKMIFKNEDGTPRLLTFHVMDTQYEGDESDDEYIDGELQNNCIIRCIRIVRKSITKSIVDSCSIS